MRWRGNVVLGMLVISFAVFTILLARNILLQSRELREIRDLQEHVRDVREIHYTQYKTEELTEEVKTEILPEYKELVKKNPDLAGWIHIGGTNIDYPVMQTLEVPEYYIHRDFAGKNSYAGMIFVGGGNIMVEAEPLFLYGHNMKNGTMFSDLLKYQKKEFWEKNSIILLDTLLEHREYKIFSSFYAAESDWELADGIFYTYKANKDFGRRVKERGIYETDIVPKQNQSLLILVTCSYHRKDGRFVVVGVLQ